MTAEEKLRRFEESISPHLASAFNLAHWLARNREDAEDIVQDAFLRAFQSFATFRGGDGRPWLLAIVRNTAMTTLKRKQTAVWTSFDDSGAEAHAASDPDPETLVLAACDREQIRKALEELPVEFREAIVLRELEGCSYREIATISGAPLGTVMSRLSRGRIWLKKVLSTVREEPA